ncbi:hypothetical protein EB235_12175 [Mesorhizobium loti R88b]|uniref:Uncharacterized protein n=1 Tax=Mesorhizobium loti R88b TaxID=935548 RepID=A0A6M7WKK3_RHILI|nr:hypothetical protein EB235_12175 [Mesorhizobium loti R88b]
MSFETRTTGDLMQIAAAGGGFVLDAATRTTSDLIQIASAARQGGARVLLRGMATRRTEDLVQIGNAGGGAVQFSSDPKPQNP